MGWCLGDPQAFQSYKLALEVAFKEVGAETTKDCDAVLEAAFTSKASGCLLSILAQPSDLATARTNVKAEVLSFRARVGKDKEKRLLHPVLWDRAQLVLSGQS